MCAIIGGTFTVASIIDSCIFTASELFKKAELGKLTWWISSYLSHAHTCVCENILFIWYLKRYFFVWGEEKGINFKREKKSGKRKTLVTFHAFVFNDKVLWKSLVDMKTDKSSNYLKLCNSFVLCEDFKIKGSFVLYLKGSFFFTPHQKTKEKKNKISCSYFLKVSSVLMKVSWFSFYLPRK